jgi:hypothetical protein
LEEEAHGFNKWQLGLHIKKTSMRHPVFVDLGYGVLDTTMVKTVAFCPEAAEKKEAS